MSLPYSRQQITEEDIAAVVSVLRSDYLTTGPKIQKFEEALAAYVGAKYAVAVSSGTAALELAYWAVKASHVVTSPLTFIATANAALVLGVALDFADVDPTTGNIENVHAWEASWDVFVPVHYAGRGCRLPSGPRIIEDACHALGAMDYDSCSRVGSCAHSLATVFSFHDVKPITTGEGGAVTTDDEGLAREIKSLRNHGRDGCGLMVQLGSNYRMTDFQAALGLSQLQRCSEMRERRMDIGDLYTHWLSGLEELTLPSHTRGVEDSWHLYPVRIKNGRRDLVKVRLNAQGIGAQIHYSPPVHLHPYYRERFGYREGSFPNAEAWAAETLSLPLHAGLTEQDVVKVCEALREALACVMR